MPTPLTAIAPGTSPIAARNPDVPASAGGMPGFSLVDDAPGDSAPAPLVTGTVTWANPPAATDSAANPPAASTMAAAARVAARYRMSDPDFEAIASSIAASPRIAEAPIQTASAQTSKAQTASAQTAGAQTASASAVGPRNRVNEAELYPDTPSSNAAPASDTKTADGSSATQPSGLEKLLWGNDGFSVGSLLRSLNPLQHIPIISSIYENLTGDKIGAVAHVIGGTLLGGPIGAVGAIANALFEGGTGKDIGGNIMAALFGDGKAASDATATVAQSTRSVDIKTGVDIKRGVDTTTAAAADLPANLGAVPSAAAAPAPTAQLATAPAAAANTALAPAASAAPASGSSPADPGAIVPASYRPGPTHPFRPAGFFMSPTAGAAESAATKSATGGAMNGGLPSNGFAGSPSSNADSAAASRAPGASPIPGDFAQKMMQALDKYRAAAKLHTLNPNMPSAAVEAGG